MPPARLCRPCVALQISICRRVRQRGPQQVVKDGCQVRPRQRCQLSGRGRQAKLALGHGAAAGAEPAPWLRHNRLRRMLLHHRVRQLPPLLLLLLLHGGGGRRQLLALLLLVAELLHELLVVVRRRDCRQRLLLVLPLPAVSGHSGRAAQQAAGVLRQRLLPELRRRRPRRLAGGVGR